MKVDELAAFIKAQTIQNIPDPHEEFAISPPSKHSEWGQQIQADGWAMISDFVDQEPEIYQRRERGLMIQSILSTYDTTKQTNYTKLDNYWQKGKTPSCLYPDTRRNGSSGKPRASGETKRGRPRTITIGAGVNITDDIAAIFHTVIKTFYTTKKAN